VILIFANICLQSSKRRTAIRQAREVISIGIMLNVAAGDGRAFATCSTGAETFVKFCKSLLSKN
jgi:hypothetical protein